MARGTGVATYGLSLVETLASMGHRSEGVFGIAVPKDPTLREVAFFDALQRPADPAKRIPRWTRRWQFASSFSPATAVDVPLTTQVEKSAFRERMPTFSRLVSAPSLFDRAFAQFRWTGKFVSLKMENPPEIMHWTYPVPVRVAGARNIYTLHDLVPLKLPYTTLDDKTMYGRVVQRCVQDAAHLCTVSESSKRDIVERYGLHDRRVSNTYQATRLPAIDGPGQAEGDARAIEGIFGLRQHGYFLYFGAIEPKKNIGRLIEAYLSLQTETPLVIVGARAWQGDEELKLMPAGGAASGAGQFVGHRGQTIVRLDYLPRKLLAQLVRGARAVVFPSLYEGFGLPVLEAMQLGTPVITSGTSSLPEIVGAAGLTVDPYDVGAIAGAMRRLDEDAGLARSLAAQGREQARHFSPERYRERLAAMYDRVMRPDS